MGRTLTARCLVVLGLSAGILTGAAACSKGPAQAKGQSAGEPAEPVKVESVRQETLRRAVEVVGTLQADEEVTVSSEAEARVSRILVDLGDRVQAGQVLVELDREKLEYRLEQQRAARNRALAKYGVSDPKATLPPIEETPDVQRAAAELAQAEQSFKRAEQLHQRQLLPGQQIDDAGSTLQVKRASHESALQNARNLRADIDASEASVRLADRELRDAAIRAPFDGYVQKRFVSPGQFLRLQTPVVSLVKVDPLKVTAEVPEKMAPWIKVGQKIELRVDAFPDKAIEGEVARISPAVTQQTRAFPLEGRVPNRAGLLKPGTFARVRIASDKVDTILSVSASALQYRYGVNRVFVISGDRLVSREVKTGDRLGDRIEIVGGVKAGESVVVSDVEKLADGVRVTITLRE